METEAEKQVKNNCYLVALDWNCIIDLEEKREGFKDILEILNFDKFLIGISGIHASENQQGKLGNLFDFKEFENKLKNIEIDIMNRSKFVELFPIGVYGFTYWDHCRYAEEGKETLYTELKKVLFPNTDFSNLPQKSSQEFRNKTCDVLSIESVIHGKADYFVTRDTNFHKKQDEIIELGRRFRNHKVQIAKPNKIIEIIRSASGGNIK